MKKFLGIFICLLLMVFPIFAQNTNLFDEEIDSELSSFVDELNTEDYQQEAQAINDIILEISSIKPETQVIDFSTYTSKIKPTNTDDFCELPLSEKMKIYRDNSLIQNEMVQAFMSVSTSKKNSQAYLEQAELVKSLMEHTTKLVEITTKIIGSSNDYVGMAIQNLTEAQSILDDANLKIALLNTQVMFLNESVAYMEEKNKRAFIAGNIVIPTVGVFGLIPSIYLMSKGDERGYDFMMVDLGVTLGCELVWNGGHFAFKWW